MKKALITGITGQDGSYMAELLISKGYEVHGIIRRSSMINTDRINHIYQDIHEKDRRLTLYHGDLADPNAIRKIIYKIQPDEIYNFGAQSHPFISFEIPEYTANITGVGVIRILEAIKDYEKYAEHKVKFYQACGSELFGPSFEPQNEEAVFNPTSPYGVSKVFSYYATKNYRKAYGIFGVCGMLFNHESPRRGGNFVTKKITMGVSDILAGKKSKIYLGQLDARRDWGYAPEYMEAVWRMMQKDSPSDYVIGTGEHHSVKEFIEKAFSLVGINNWENYVECEQRYQRPDDAECLVADASRAKAELEWEAKIRFGDLIKIMLKHDLERNKLYEYSKKLELS